MNYFPLESMLKDLTLHELEIILQIILAREGFGEVEIQDRRLVGQTSRNFGHELVCRRTLGGIRQKIIVKIISKDIRIHQLSEMAGEIDRNEADMGLIISTHRTCKSAAKEIHKYTKSRIEVIDGPILARLLTKHRIGVRPSGEPDHAYFSGLREGSNTVISIITKFRNEAH